MVAKGKTKSKVKKIIHSRKCLPNNYFRYAEQKRTKSKENFSVLDAFEVGKSSKLLLLIQYLKSSLFLSLSPYELHFMREKFVHVLWRFIGIRLFRST